MITNTMPSHATMFVFLMHLLVQSYTGSANLGETCKCGVAYVAADDAAAATAAIITGTDSDDTVDVAASTVGLSLFAVQ